MSDPEREVAIEEDFNQNPMYDDHMDLSICFSPSPEACYNNYYSPGGSMFLSRDATLICISQSVPRSPEFELPPWNFSDEDFIPSTQPHVHSPSPPPLELSPSPAPQELFNPGLQSIFNLVSSLESWIESSQSIDEMLQSLKIEMLQSLKILKEEFKEKKLNIVKFARKVLQQLEEFVLVQELDELELEEDVQEKKLKIVKFERKVLQRLEEFVLVQELDRLQNENRELHKFIQHASQITLQTKIDIAHEICEEGHDNSSIEILDKMTAVAGNFQFHLSWTKAPCWHRSLANGGDLKKSCTSFDGCHMHQDCMSTAKLEIYVEHCREMFQGELCSHIEDRFVQYSRKIELQSFHAICEPIASVVVSCPENEGNRKQCRKIKRKITREDLSVSYPENEGKCRKINRELTLEGIQHFPGRLVDAAESFGVSKSTLKRFCRDNGITDWRDRGINENSQSLSKRKDIIESVQGEGAEIGNQMSTQMEITPAPDMFVSSHHEQCIEEGNPSKLPVQLSELNFSAACLSPAAINFTQVDHNISATVAFDIEQVPESSQTNLTCSDPAPKLAEATAAPMTALVTEMKDTRTVTMKAIYGKDMIRFQLSLTSGIIELRKKVAERLMLEVGTFSIKYLDDYEDWILMTGDEDLQECFNISVSLGRKVIKLSIHEITPS